MDEQAKRHLYETTKKDGETFEQWLESLHRTKKRPIPEELVMLSGDKYVADRSGLSAYVHIIRDPSDPEEVRSKGRDPVGWRKIDKQSIERWAHLIMNHLEDGVPRTFNRISVELLNRTADVTFQTAFDEALWSLVLEGKVEHTVVAPTLFRKRMRPLPEDELNAMRRNLPSQD